MHAMTTRLIRTLAGGAALALTLTMSACGSDDAEPNADMWATAEESRADIVGLYQRVWAHSDATLSQLPLDTVGEVPWWSEGSRRVTLQHIAVHMIAETNRHAGHADVLREVLDGVTGR